MTLLKTLQTRSNSKCELCSATENLQIYTVPPEQNENPDNNILVCSTCHEQIADPEKVQANHWRCLNDSMWSEIAAVKVMAYRMLHRLRSESWPIDLLDMMYLDEETLTWAQATGEGTEQEETVIHMDSNGTQLQSGDSITLIKSLDVKGTSFIAKRGTAVRNISLVMDNPEHIEGRVNGQKIIILTKFVKKS